MPIQPEHPDQPHTPPPTDPLSADASWNAVSRDCPSWKALEAFAAGTTDDPHTQKHVAKCPRCSRLITEIRSNSGVAQLLGQVVSPAHVQAKPSSLDVAPDLVPGYTLIEELHRGGQGIVYRAHQDGTKREVAVKMLLAGVFSTDKQRQRFELEAEIAANLRHPCIATVYEVVPMRAERYAIAMEYVQGVRIDQHEFAGQSAKARLDACLSVFCNVCDAVTAAHRAGVIHRDLKPSNILVDKANAPRLLDFGIARRAEVGAQSTMTGDSAWTLGYASPEQINDPRAVDVRSDVYSLGVVLYELLAGAPPLELSNLPLSQAIARIRDAAPDPLRLRKEFGAGSAPRDLAAVVMHALEKRPEHRYQSAEALAADLRRLREGRAVIAPQLGAWYRLRKAAAKRWKPLLAIAAILTAITAGLLAWSNQRTRAQIASSRAVQESSNAEGVRILTFQMLGPTQVSLTDSPRTAQREIIDSLSLRLDMGELRSRPRTDASLRTILASIYFSHKLYVQAEHHQREALRSLARSVEQAPVDASLHNSAVAKLKTDLANTLLAQGLQSKAREACEPIATDSSLPLEDRLEAQATLGTICVAENNTSAASTHAQHARDLWTRLGSPKDLEPTVLELETRISLAEGNREKAHELANRSMLARIRTTFDEDPRTLETMLLLAETVDTPPAPFTNMPPAVVDKLREGKKIGTDPTARGYWDLARAQVYDESKGRLVEFYDEALLRTGIVSATLLARDGMYTKARNKAVWTWVRLGKLPDEEVDSKLAIAMLCRDWALRDGDTHEADIWAGHALALARKRSTQTDPDCRLPSITLAAAQCAASVADYARAKRLLDEARTAESERKGRPGAIAASCDELAALIEYVEHDTPLPTHTPPQTDLSPDRSDESRVVSLIAHALDSSQRDQDDQTHKALSASDLTAITRCAQTIATSQLHRETLRKTIPALRSKGHEALASQLEGVLRRADTPIALEKDWITPAPAQ